MSRQFRPGQLQTSSLYNISSSYALTASYVTNLYSSNYTQSFSNQSTWTVIHNLQTRYVIVQTFDTNYDEMIPQNIDLTDNNTVTITFPTYESGVAVVTVGGALQNTSPTSMSYALTADMLDGKDSTVFATTGSNTFFGNQTINGNITLTGSADNGYGLSSVVQFVSGAVIVTNGPNLDMTAGPGGWSEIGSNNGQNFVWVDDQGVYLVTSWNGDTATSAWSFETGSRKLKASGNLDMNGYFISSSIINFNSSSAGGVLSWNATDGTLDLTMGYSNATNQIGQELYNPPVVNKSGGLLLDGDLVMVDPSGIAQGQRVAVVKCIADGTYPADYIVGVMTGDLAINQTGFATWFGYVRNINKTHLFPTGETWAEGDVLYPHPTEPGKMTNTQPSSPNLKSTIAVVTAINGNNVTLMVRPSLRGKLDSLHNVTITSSSYGDLLMRSGSIWINTKQLSGSYSISGSLIVTGSTQGNVVALTISSNTASMDLSQSNFFTLQLVSGSNTYINPSNIRPGVSSTLLISTTGSGTVSFPTTVKQPSGSAYVPTTSAGKDVLTFISYDSSTLYVASAKNMI